MSYKNNLHQNIDEIIPPIIEKAMMQQEGVTETLKTADQIAWVRSMNSIHNRAEEIVLAELVYCCGRERYDFGSHV